MDGKLVRLVAIGVGLFLVAVGMPIPGVPGYCLIILGSVLVGANA
jgi:hypothetical protein